MEKYELIICTEKGPLEAMSKLLVYSLRKFGGRFKNIPIYSYQPRREFPISQDTINWFERYEVNYVDVPLNKQFQHYPLANKPLACAYHEKNSRADYLLFMDSDIFFLQEPTAYADFADMEVLIRPVALRNIGAGSKEEPNALYWQKLYEQLGVQAERKITSVIDQHQIWEYYNSGQIASRRTSQLFSNWLDNFTRMMASGIRPDHGIFFLEQSVLSATISQLELSVKQVDQYYNIPARILLRPAYAAEYPVEACVSIHYHKIFDNPEGHNPLMDFLAPHPAGNLINQRIEKTLLSTILQ